MSTPKIADLFMQHAMTMRTNDGTLIGKLSCDSFALAVATYCNADRESRYDITTANTRIAELEAIHKQGAADIASLHEHNASVERALAEANEKVFQFTHANQALTTSLAIADQEHGKAIQTIAREINLHAETQKKLNDLQMAIHNLTTTQR